MTVAFSVVMLITIFIIYVINIYLIDFNVALTGRSGQFDSPIHKYINLRIIRTNLGP